jgi:transcription elongation GreA/GreB family factor
MDLKALNDTQKLELKQQLKNAAMEILMKRRTSIQQAMDDAQESANSEDKGSAGDKYETGRAMSQLNKEMHAKQLEETNIEISNLSTVNAEVLHDKAGTGAIVATPQSVLFISVGVGAIVIDNQKIMAVSPQAPIALALLNKKAGEAFTLNGKSIAVLQVF